MERNQFISVTTQELLPYSTTELKLKLIDQKYR